MRNNKNSVFSVSSLCTLCAILLFVLVPVHQAHAQQKQPLEITADGSLEWHRNTKQYIARKNAVAKQGATELRANTLTAAYNDDNKTQGINISRIDAQGQVTIKSDGSTATGDQGYYDIKTGYSELTGNNLALKTATDTVTARDKLTYNAKQNEMNAYGAARAVKGTDIITADRLTGRFENSKMKQLEATGNVVITTKTDVLYGDRGIYDARANKATIIGNVRIERDGSFITGARGEVDLNTNISRMFAEKPSETGTGTGRVRGVFYTDTE